MNNVETFSKDTFCSFCGTKFAEQKLYPRKCFRCGNDKWSNPLPVVCMLYNVWENNHLGSLIQRRNIEPKKGEWALTGGYIDEGESWRDAAVREAREELGIETIHEGYTILDAMSNTSKSSILIFVSYIRALHMDEIHFVPNEEVQAIKIVHEAVELAFPTHTEMLARRFPSHLKDSFPLPPSPVHGPTK